MQPREHLTETAMPRGAIAGTDAVGNMGLANPANSTTRSVPSTAEPGLGPRGAELSRLSCIIRSQLNSVREGF